MPKRKTFPVKELREKINSRNRQSICSADCRNAWNSILADVLMETGNYHGFRYLRSDEVPSGEKPGINHKTIDVESKKLLSPENIEENFPDSSRVEYY